MTPKTVNLVSHPLVQHKLSLMRDKTTTDRLVEIVQRTLGRGGRLIVPAFAVGRTQEFVATLHDLIEAGRLPEVPMFVDSPMARNATASYFSGFTVCPR